MIKTIGMICVLAILAPVTIAAGDESLMPSMFKPPVFNPTPEGFFTERMNLIHSGMVEMEGPDVFFIDGGGKLIVDPLASRLHILAGSMLPVLNNLAIPVFFQWFGIEDDGNGKDLKEDSFMIGSGLVFHGRFGALAGYAGYTGGKGESHEWSDTSKTIIDKEWDINKFQWAFFPAINAQEYPFLNIIAKQIDGFLAFDNRMNAGGFKPSYKANVLFKNIFLGNERKWYVTFGTYTVSDWYDPYAKYKLYAASADISSLDWWTIRIEAGSRNFFDIQNSKGEYENGLYSKIGLRIPIVEFSREMLFGIMAFLESGPKNFLGSPYVGLVFSIFGKGAAGGGGSFDLNNIIGLSGFNMNVSMDLFTARKDY